MAQAGEHPTAFVDGRYEVRSLLGSGGTATVYRVYDTALGVERAFKVLRIRNKDLGRRLAAEARTMARLDHPNILRVVDVGVDDGQPYIVMELLPGGTLADRAESGPLPARAALEWTLQILAALAAAHAIGVVHRDVKPSNVLLDKDGGARLADFGIAMHAGAPDDRSTRTGMALGTLAYMAPEQRLDARSVSVAADLYAVGATLFALLTLRNPMDLFIVEPGDKRLEGLPDAIAAIIVRATRYRPEDRYASAAEMARDIIAALEEVGERPLVEAPVEHELPEPSTAVRTPAAAVPRLPSADLTWNAIDMLTQSLPAEAHVPGPTVVPPLDEPVAEEPLGRRATPLWIPLVAGFALVAAAIGVGVGVGLVGISGDPADADADASAVAVPEPDDAVPPVEPGVPPEVEDPAPDAVADAAPVPEPAAPAPVRPEPAAPAPVRPESTPAASTVPAPVPAPAGGPFPIGEWIGVLDGRPTRYTLTGTPADLTLVARSSWNPDAPPRAFAGAYDAATSTLSVADVTSGPGRGTITATWNGRTFDGRFEAFSGDHTSVFQMSAPAGDR